MSTHKDRVAALRSIRSKIPGDLITLKGFARCVASEFGWTFEKTRHALRALPDDVKTHLKIGVRSAESIYAKRLKICRNVRPLITEYTISCRTFADKVAADLGLKPDGARHFVSTLLKEHKSELRIVDHHGQGKRSNLTGGELFNRSALVVSMDKPVGRDSEDTLHDILGSEDLGYGNFEKRQMLEVVRKINGITARFADLLDLIIAGQDIEENEYKDLAEAIKGREDLMAVLEPA